MTSSALLFSAILVPFVAAFAPEFSTPSQCGELTISWSSSPLSGWEVTDPIMSSEISLSLVPIDSNPAQFPPAPYTLSVPCSLDTPSGSAIVPALPFPGGTQFFASAYVPGAPGLDRRQVSSLLTVAYSTDHSCLPSTPSPAIQEGRSRVKSFGKRQVSVIGTGVVDATATFPSVASSAPTEAIRVIGPSTIPLQDADANTAIQAPVNNVAPLPDNASGTPAIIEIGTSVIADDAATATSTEQGNFVDVSPTENVSPPPAETFSPDNSGEYNYGDSYGQDQYDNAQTEAALESSPAYDEYSYDNSEATATEEADCTETVTESAEMEYQTEYDQYSDYQSSSDEQSQSDSEYQYDQSQSDSEYQYDQSQSDSEYQYDQSQSDSEYQYDQSQSDSEYQYDQGSDSYSQDSSDYGYDNQQSSADDMYSYESQSTDAVNTEVKHYDSFDEMVNAANYYFKAWNPYRTYGYPPPIAAASATGYQY